MKESTKSSRLYYHGTSEEVRLGDRVKIKRLFGRDLEGFVCYVPGISPPHKDLEYGSVKKWAIKTSDGTVYAIGYYPPRIQPRKKIVFVSRGDEKESLKPDEILDANTTREGEEEDLS